MQQIRGKIFGSFNLKKQFRDPLFIILRTNIVNLSGEIDVKITLQIYRNLIFDIGPNLFKKFTHL